MIRFFLFLPLVVSSCISFDEETEIDSDDYSSPSERVEVLKNELNPPSDFSDAEFELFNVNGFSTSRHSMVGPSSRDYKFAIRIKKSDLDQWIFQRDTCNSPDWDLSWIHEIVKQRKSVWKMNGSPIIYGVPDDQLIYYPKNGILFRRAIMR